MALSSRLSSANCFNHPSNQPLAQGFGDGFGFRVDLQFFVDVAEMKRNGVITDVEVVGGGFIAVTFDEHF